MFKRLALAATAVALLLAVRVAPDLQVSLADGTTTLRFEVVAPDGGADGGFVISNQGRGPSLMTVSSIALLGDDAGVFVLGTLTTNPIPSLESATVSVRFQPNGLEGPFSARLVVTTPSETNEEVVLCARSTSNPSAWGVPSGLCDAPRLPPPPDMPTRGCSSTASVLGLLALLPLLRRRA